jgi:hypothetical protein
MNLATITEQNFPGLEEWDEKTIRAVDKSITHGIANLIVLLNFCDK